MPTKNYITDSGAQVLILTENFYDFFKAEDLLDWYNNPLEIIKIANISGE